jgi:hypothetical protein
VTGRPTRDGWRQDPLRKGTQRRDHVVQLIYLKKDQEVLRVSRGHALASCCSEGCVSNRAGVGAMKAEMRSKTTNRVWRDRLEEGCWVILVPADPEHMKMDDGSKMC